MLLRHISCKISGHPISIIESLSLAFHDNQAEVDINSENVSHTNEHFVNDSEEMVNIRSFSSHRKVYYIILAQAFFFINKKFDRQSIEG